MTHLQSKVQNIKNEDLKDKTKIFFMSKIQRGLLGIEKLVIQVVKELLGTCKDYWIMGLV